MSKAIPNDYKALLKEASDMFEATGCVPGIDGEQVPAERIVPDAKEYIFETIDNPRAVYDPDIWDTPGFALVVFMAGTKMATKVSNTRTSEKQEPGTALDPRAAKGMSRLGCSRVDP